MVGGMGSSPEMDVAASGGVEKPRLGNVEFCQREVGAPYFEGKVGFGEDERGSAGGQ